MERERKLVNERVRESGVGNKREPETEIQLNRMQTFKQNIRSHFLSRLAIESDEWCTSLNFQGGCKKQRKADCRNVYLGICFRYLAA